MTAEHNHPPRCCCPLVAGTTARAEVCPLCVEHGELAQLGKECPSCHTTDGHPHTDYCNLAPEGTGGYDVACLNLTCTHPLKADCSPACGHSHPDLIAEP